MYNFSDEVGLTFLTTHQCSTVLAYLQFNPRDCLQKHLIASNKVNLLCVTALPF